MNATNDSGAPKAIEILVAGEDLNFRPVTIERSEIRGEDLAASRGFKPAEYPVVLAMLEDGQLESLRVDEVARVRQGQNKFIVVASDRSYRWSLDGQFDEWPCRFLSGAHIRKLGNVPRDKVLFLTRVDHPDHPIDDCELIDLDPPSVETFISRHRTYKLEVQGVELTLHQPTIVVREAMVLAGFDPAQKWQIFVVIAGQPKLKVDESYVVDLRTPGIEKIRLSPDAVVNADARPGLRRAFTPLPRDEAHLNRLGLPWETVIVGPRRFVIIHGYRIPRGYSVAICKLALELPSAYPQQGIYGFFTQPTLSITSGRMIPNTTQSATIDGQTLVGWSRQRTKVWDAQHDGIASHLMTVDAALAQEVGE